MTTLEDFDREMRKDPAYVAARTEIEAQCDRAVTTTCNYGNCQVHVDPLDGTIISSFGPIECPCDHTPGWKARRLASAGRPHMPMKAKGRNGGRIMRGRKRHSNVKDGWVSL